MSALFSLIKKLTKSEKRRFKLYSLKKSGQNQYLILFEFMEALSSENEEYCEEKLISQLKEEDFFKKNKKQQTNTNYLRSTQFYLREQIMKTLRTLCEAEKKPSSLINIKLINAELASRKDLEKLKEKEIKKAITLAQEFDLTEDLLRVKRLQVGLSHYSFDKNTPKRVNDLHEDMLELVQQLKVEIEYSQLYYKLYHAYLEGFRYSKNRKELKQFNIDVDSLDLKTAAKNFHTHYIYYKIKAFFNLLSNKLDQTFGYLIKALELWEEREKFVLKYPMRYQALLINYLNICIITNKYDEHYSSLLTKMKKLKIGHRKDHVYNQAMIIQIEQLRILNTSGFDDAADFITEVDKFLVQYKKEVTDTKQFNFQYNTMILYFMMEDYENALIRSKTLLNFSNKRARKDLKGKTIVFHLIFLYERNNKKELVDAISDEEEDEYWDAIAGAKGKLVRQKQHNAFHKLLQRRLLNITFLSNPQSIKIEFHKIRSALFELREKIGANNIGGLGIQEAIYWVNSKITGKSIREIIEEDRNSDDKEN